MLYHNSLFSNESTHNWVCFFRFFCYSWVIYEKPGFQGRSIALEEGGIELTNMWADPGLQTEPQNTPPAVVGSIRLVVCVSEINTRLNLLRPSVFRMSTSLCPLSGPQNLSEDQTLACPESHTLILSTESVHSAFTLMTMNTLCRLKTVQKLNAHQWTLQQTLWSWRSGVVALWC